MTVFKKQTNTVQMFQNKQREASVRAPTDLARYCFERLI